MDIQKLLRSGNFTLYYSDNGSWDLYKAKFDPEDEDIDWEALDQFKVDEGYGDGPGYCPSIVADLVDALGGEVGSV